VYGHALVPSDRAVWVDESLRPQPRDIYDETKLAAERLVTSTAIPAVVLRIARCFPEPLRVGATHLLHRGVDLTDVATAVRLAAEQEKVTGTFTIAGPYVFTRADCAEVYRDAARVIADRCPAIAGAFHDRGWPLPRTLDRIYDSSAATAALGYQPVHDVLHLLGKAK
jgi:UDP-glucose 4-epimerase